MRMNNFGGSQRPLHSARWFQQKGEISRSGRPGVVEGWRMDVEQSSYMRDEQGPMWLHHVRLKA